MTPKWEYGLTYRVDQTSLLASRAMIDQPEI